MGIISTYKCKFCRRVSHGNMWDYVTLEKCKCKEAKKMYIPISNDKCREKSGEYFYSCPKCNKLNDGCEVIIY